MGFLLQTLDWVKRLLGLLETKPLFRFCFLDVFFTRSTLNPFFIQVDKDMFLEVDGIVGIIDLTDDEAFLVHGAAG